MFLNRKSKEMSKRKVLVVHITNEMKIITQELGEFEGKDEKFDSHFTKLNGLKLLSGMIKLAGLCQDLFSDKITTERALEKLYNVADTLKNHLFGKVLLMAFDDTVELTLKGDGMEEYLDSQKKYACLQASCFRLEAWLSGLCENLNK